MFIRKDLDGKFLFLRHCPNDNYISQTTSKFLKLFGAARNQRTFSTLGDILNIGICAGIAYYKFLKVLITGGDPFILPSCDLLVLDKSSKQYINETERVKFLKKKRNNARKTYRTNKNNGVVDSLIVPSNKNNGKLRKSNRSLRTPAGLDQNNVTNSFPSI